eukprot:CAMPEP_0119013598 /NCGR_PEP_ID=MMETSP1176-20130426/8551_1 /TAXON_ID=265551 /ORGANISM="Synedropsis recta cf, Strain CCMP1620" /LENGTH=87 /DNA_ID=CAMNT_0006966701 /DNA_START=69 /DNA_END=332 /DNA_ORIENTATION=+
MKTIIALCLLVLSQLSTTSAFSVSFAAHAPFALSFSAFGLRRGAKKQPTAAHTELLEYNTKCNQIIENERKAALLHYLAHSAVQKSG